jgi:hypothetical protein
MTLTEGLEVINGYGQGNTPLDKVLDYISTVEFNEKEFAESLEEIGSMKKYPEVYSKMLSFYSFLLGKKKAVGNLYEQAMVKYKEIDTLIQNKRPTDDEVKIKKFLNDYIIKLEKIFESNGMTDEAFVKEISRFISESNVIGLTESEVQTTRFTTKHQTLMEPHLDKLRDFYYQYHKIEDLLGRLVRIAGYILEEGKIAVS